MRAGRAGLPQLSHWTVRTAPRSVILRPGGDLLVLGAGVAVGTGVGAGRRRDRRGDGMGRPTARPREIETTATDAGRDRRGPDADGLAPGSRRAAAAAGRNANAPAATRAIRTRAATAATAIRGRRGVEPAGGRGRDGRVRAAGSRQESGAEPGVAPPDCSARAGAAAAPGARPRHRRPLATAPRGGRLAPMGSVPDATPAAAARLGRGRDRAGPGRRRASSPAARRRRLGHERRPEGHRVLGMRVDRDRPAGRLADHLRDERDPRAAADEQDAVHAVERRARRS